MVYSAKSAYLYLAMSAYCDAQNLKGFAHWLKVQYQEETAHALKLLAYLQERGGIVRLQAIEAPEGEFGSPAEVFENVLAHEQHVTKLINQLYEVAIAEKDYAAQAFLQWFINEQVEEEASANTILAYLKMLGNDKSGILCLDSELGKRAG